MHNVSFGQRWGVQRSITILRIVIVLILPPVIVSSNQFTINILYFIGEITAINGIFEF